MRTIRVTGKGQLKVKPDTTRITMTLAGLYEEYDETLRRSSADTEVLKDIFSDFGFDRSDLKTKSFDVNTEYESYRDNNNDYKEHFIGYQYTHVLKVEFDSDNDRLGKILYALTNCTVSPKFRISYTVKDTTAAKNQLLEKAIADAKEKAAVLAHASGVALKDIQSIDYSWGEIDFEYSPMSTEIGERCLRVLETPSYDLDIEPDDIKVSDTATVGWEIG